MLPQLTKFKGVALNLLFPQYCVGCGRDGAFICSGCAAALPHIEPPLCPRCGIPESSGGLCHNGVHWTAEIDGIRAPFRFEGIIREAIHQFKYQNLRAIATTLVEMLRLYVDANPVKADILMPVPLHAKRLRERGYNQSGLLAQELSRRLGIPVDEKSLIRTRHSLPQARTTGVAERHRNVIGLFACSSVAVQGKNVMVIDDVTTSGATLNACAAALKKSGAASVWGLALAKEI